MWSQTKAVKFNSEDLLEKLELISAESKQHKVPQTGWRMRGKRLQARRWLKLRTQGADS